MALAVDMVGMGANDGQGVHPFFSTARNATIHLVQDQIFPHLSDPAKDSSKKKSTRKARKAKINGESPKVKQPPLTTNGNINLRTRPDSKTNLGDATLKRLSHTHSGDERLGPHSQSDTFEVDLNLDRRKRRRTLSPCLAPHPPETGSEGELVAQLRAAAFGEREESPSQKNKQLRRIESSPDLDRSGEEQNIVDLNRTLSPTEEQDIAPTDSLELTKGFSSSTTTITPPKKLLKLNSNGKLGSPDLREITYRGKTRGRKKGTVVKGSTKTKILILRYGHDEDSRKATAQKINNICSRQVFKAEAFLADSEKPFAKPTSDAQSKPTHPFFLGTAMHRDDGETSSTTNDPSDSHPSGGQCIVPPKKAQMMSRANANAWTIFGDLKTHESSSNYTRIPRFSTSMEPAWPSRDMLHCRGLPPGSIQLPSSSHLYTKQRKLKNAETQIHKTDSVLWPYSQSIHFPRFSTDFGIGAVKTMDNFQRPRRIVMTSLEIQKDICKRVESKLTSGEKSTETAGHTEDGFDSLPPHAQAHTPTHHALLHIFQRIAITYTAFDEFRCETQEWVHKYAPKCSLDVLQQGSEVILLRDWLKSLIVSSVDNGGKDSSRIQESLLTLKRATLKAKKKRKRQDELDGFIVPSDEETDKMDELIETDELTPSKENVSLIKRSVIRAGETSGLPRALGDPVRSTNAVIISGPHGCGKTATVYAVAQELGFEVFEINSGSRRSGKDLLDKVGDMTKNHLVHKSQEINDLKLLAEEEINTKDQSIMTTFLKPMTKNKKKSKITRSPKPTDERPDRSKGQHNQKQSLILLEEVDVLFEEDKQFWATALALIYQSKRPIIMTCTDEKQLPLDQMTLHAIFRLKPPTITLATDYLLLIAANEGHLLSRSTISSLYRAKCADLRASMMELNFWCQMAIGDTKGGLEWMPIPSPSNRYINSKGERQRVVSEGSYVEGMGIMGGMTILDGDSDSKLEDFELLTTASQAWEIDVEEWHGLMDDQISAYASGQMTKRELMDTLTLFDTMTDAMSAADIYPGSKTSRDDRVVLDVTLPKLTEKMSNNYIEGFHLLQADPLQDPTGINTSLPLALTACFRRLLYLDKHEHALCYWSRATVNRYIIERTQKGVSSRPVTQDSIFFAFEPLLDPSRVSPLQSRGPGITTFDGPLSAVVEDVGPYVRSIITYDLRLEEQRLRLSNLLSERGRSGKRQRTTRASRAALEGGNKALTRRERWFPSHTNFPLILQTGGEGWQEAVWQALDTNISEPEATRNDSRQSSVGTTGSEV